MSKPFKPGDPVVWRKQDGRPVLPILATVLAVTERRVKIEARADEGKVIRHVLPGSIEHHATRPKSERKPPAKPAAGRSKRTGPIVFWSGRVSRPKKDEAREQRITMEIVVDAYNEYERAIGWRCYLEEKLDVPFRARCVEEREVSPLSVGDEVEAVGMPRDRECEREMFVSIDWDERTLAVPLAQLEVVRASKQTREAVKDWHYWVGMGNSF